jgi:hypothetical protein
MGAQHPQQEKCWLYIVSQILAQTVFYIKILVTKYFHTCSLHSNTIQIMVRFELPATPLKLQANCISLKAWLDFAFSARTKYQDTNVQLTT